MPNPADLHKKLQDLSLSKRSKTAWIRELLPSIERAVAAGATYEEIVEGLRQTGLAMSRATFATALKRVRKSAKSEPPQLRSATWPGSLPKSEATNASGASPASLRREDFPELNEQQWRQRFADQFSAPASADNDPLLQRIAERQRLASIEQIDQSTGLGHSAYAATTKANSAAEASPVSGR